MTPDGWEEKNLGEVAVLQRGFDLPKNKRIPGSIPVVSSSGVSGLHNKARAKGPGIVTGRYGTIGEVFYVERDFWPLNTTLWVKHFCGNHARYIFYLLGKLNFRKFSDKTGVPGVNRNDLHKIRTLVPPLEEQRKIARILSTWDKAIETVQKLIEVDKKRKKAQLQQLLTGKIRFNGFKGKMKRVHIRDVAEVDSKSLGKETAGSYLFRYICLSNVEAGSISNDLATHRFGDSPSRARRVVREGDVLMATVRPNLQAFARVGKHHAACIASTAFAILSPREDVDGSYLYHYLFSAHVSGQIYSLVAGSNYPAINSADIKTLAIDCPGMDEQRMIAGILSNTEAIIDNLTEQVRVLKKQKKTLVQQLLAGKRRVAPDEKPSDWRTPERGEPR